ncbi:MAG: calcium-binding protein [Paracoccus sp. (in: a-proteobacteria)]
MNFFRGGYGPDRLVGTLQADVIQALEGDDTVNGLGGADDIDGGAGDDRILGGAGGDGLRGDFGDDRIWGEDGNDSLDGGEGNDRLWGGAGDDKLFESEGNDLLDGGEGARDRLFIGSDSGAVRRIDLMKTVAQDTGAGHDIIRNIEIVQATHDFAVWFRGGAGRETLIGGGGDDTLISAGEADLLRGGDGYDLLIGAATATHRPVFDGGAGLGDVARLSNGDDVSSFASFRGIEYIDGAGGNDLLSSAGRAVSLLGGAGQDTLRPGAGQQILDGEAGIDTLDLRLTQPGVRVDLDEFGYQRVGDWALSLLNIENLRATGGADQVFGSAAANWLAGLAGNDRLAGRGGNDSLLGNAGDDMLSGNAGDDRIRGGAGDDRLDGGAGRDRLWGEAGADSFLFRAGGGRDVIVDFQAAEDEVLYFGSQASYDQAVATAQVVDGDLVLRPGGGDLITLKGVDDLSGLDQWFLLGA